MKRSLSEHTRPQNKKTNMSVCLKILKKTKKNSKKLCSTRWRSSNNGVKRLENSIFCFYFSFCFFVFFFSISSSRHSSKTEAAEEKYTNEKPTTNMFNVFVCVCVNVFVQAQKEQNKTLTKLI